MFSLYSGKLQHILFYNIVAINCNNSYALIEKNYNESIKNTFVISNCYLEINYMILQIYTDYGTLENSYINCQKGYLDTLTLTF